MSKLRTLLGFFSALTALVGCDEGPASNLSFTTTPDVWSFVVAAASGGPLPVEVHGNPFREPDPVVAREITRAVDETFTEPWLRFSDSRDGASSSEARLIWLLDPESGFDPDMVCAGQLPSFTTGRRVSEIRAVFCLRQRPLSAVHGWMRLPDSASDPRWRTLISQMARQLLSGRG